MRAEADHAREDVGAAHAKLRAIADEQAALRRMAALVARGAAVGGVRGGRRGGGAAARG